MAATEFLVRSFDGGLKTFDLPNYSLDFMTVQLLKKMLVEQIFLNLGATNDLKLIHKGKPMDDDFAPLSRYVTSQDEAQKVKEVHGGKSQVEVPKLKEVYEDKPRVEVPKVREVYEDKPRVEVPKVREVYEDKPRVEVPKLKEVHEDKPRVEVPKVNGGKSRIEIQLIKKVHGG